MIIKITFGRVRNIAQAPVEIVERKGLGHPDTIADLVAEAFSNKYSKYCLEKFGIILNHWVDKATVAGAEATLDFGEAKINKPITVYLFGKVTAGIGKEKVPIGQIFRESVREIFLGIFRDEAILNNVRYVTNINATVGTDHPSSFYYPKSPLELRKLEMMQTANDTTYCCGYSNYTRVELLAIELENYVNSGEFKRKFPETGWDVKVLIVRIDKNLYITICVPFIARATPSPEYYRKKLNVIRKDIFKKAISYYKSDNIKLSVNTKDRERFGYLTVFGSSLDKGDYGVVGRGNRQNGIISSNRGTSIEAPSGKNPVHHVGKLYHFISNGIAREIFKKHGFEADVYIATMSGEPLNQPTFVLINLPHGIEVTKGDLEEIVIFHLSHIKEYTDFVIALDPIKWHIKRHKYEFPKIF